MEPAAVDSHPHPAALPSRLETLAATVAGRAVVFFDGNCVMCNAFVLFVHRRDRHDRLRFSPLDGECYKLVAEAAPAVSGVDSMILAEFERAGLAATHLRSSAALRTLMLLGGVWGGLAGLAALVPRPVRDAVYQLIASVRYRMFGRYDSCPLPPPDLARKLLP